MCVSKSLRDTGMCLVRKLPLKKVLCEQLVRGYINLCTLHPYKYLKCNVKFIPMYSNVDLGQLETHYVINLLIKNQ